MVRISSNDMRESYAFGDAVLVKKAFNHFNYNDVLLFTSPLRDSGVKESNFIQRLIALPGDSLEIDDKIIFVNGQIVKDGLLYKQNYFIHLNDVKFDSAFAKKYAHLEGGKIETDLEYGFSLTDKQFDSIQKETCIKSIKIKEEKKENFDENCFPYSEHYRWNRDHYGKIYIPKKNDVLQLDTMNLDLYASIIEQENNMLNVSGDSIFINQQKVNTYTVQQNYYFMMGDNRDNAVDSRIWGFLPENKIKGKIIYCLRRAK